MVENTKQSVSDIVYQTEDYFVQFLRTRVKLFGPVEYISLQDIDDAIAFVDEKMIHEPARRETKQCAQPISWTEHVEILNDSFQN